VVLAAASANQKCGRRRKCPCKTPLSLKEEMIFGRARGELRAIALIVTAALLISVLKSCSIAWILADDC